MKNGSNNIAMDDVNIKRLLIKTIVGLLSLTAVFILAGILFKTQFYSVGRYFVEHYGGVALFFSFFITAICPIPLPDHAMSALAAVGGMSFWHNVLISSIGSITGGIIAYCLGGLLRNTVLYQRIMSRYYEQSERLVEKYGLLSLGLAALTPIPDSPISWLCGALGVPLERYIIIYAFCRVIKITYFLWFINLGIKAI